MRRIRWYVLFLAAILVLSGCSLLDKRPGVTRDWRLMEKSAVGTTVNLYAWAGDENANKWIDETLKPYLAETYKIKLRRVPMNYDEIFKLMASDMEAKRSSGDIDLLWISGSNFEYAMKNKYLFGPFATKLPNVTTYLDTLNPEFIKDRGVLLENYAVPMGRKQMAFFYNEDVIYDPPTDLDSLMTTVKANPGLFTYPDPGDPLGMAFIETVIYGKADTKAILELGPSRSEVAALIAPALKYLQTMEPYLWKKGTAYPASESEIDRLFASDALAIAMSTDHNHATKLISEDRYNPGAKPFKLNSGTVGTTHYLAIPWNATNKSGAMVVINGVLDISMQASKFRPSVWGDIPVLNLDALLPEDLKTLKKSVNKKTSPKLEDLVKYRNPQLSPAVEAIIRDLWYEQIGS